MTARRLHQPRPAAETGFTLLEVLVALAIFALAALALLRLQSASLAGSAMLDRRLLRAVEADNRATEWRTESAPPVAGVAGGVVVNGGRRLAWQRVVRREGAFWVAQITVRALDMPGEASLARAVRAAS